MSAPVPQLLLFLAVCSLGVSAFVTQLTLMRELLSAFSGNELIFGIVLGNWLLLTGLGSALGRTASRLKSPLAVLVAGQILVAVLPLADVFLLRAVRNVVFVRGAEVGITETVVACLVLLAPYCLTTGYLLTAACLILAAKHAGPNLPLPLGEGRGEGSATEHHDAPSPNLSQRERSRQDSDSIGQVYFLDNVGSVLGGLLFSFVLIHLFDHFGVLYFPAFLNLLFAGLVAWWSGSRMLAALAAAAAVALVGLMAACNLDQRTTAIQYAPQHVVYHGHSPYGDLVVTESAGQLSFLENGVPLFSSHSPEEAEETVHYAMAQRPQARRVLLISGGVSGTAREILKYRTAAVDYVELDPLILRVAQRYLPESLADPRIEVINTDGRLLIKQAQRRYDVVIVDVPAPSTSQLNRFYTREFFAEVKRVLQPGGVLSFSLGTYEDYLSKELADLIAVAQRTLKSVFANVLILPGGRVFFLASDGELTTEVAPRLEQAGIATRRVNRHYLRGMFIPSRLEDVARAIRDDAPLNEDFSPILYYYHLRYWISHFRYRFGMLQAGLLALLGVYLVRMRPVPLAIFAGGFAASALEVVLLMALQILYGCLYYQVGLIVTMFMLGLGIGSFTMNRWLTRFARKHLMWLALAIALYGVCLPPVLGVLGRASGGVAMWAAQAAIPLLTLLLAVLVGLEFPLAGKVSFAGVSSTAAQLYTADFVGAAVGALLVSTLLIPVMGVTAVCLLAAGLNVISAIVILLTARA